MRKFMVAAATAAAAFAFVGAVTIGAIAADKGGPAPDATLDQLIAGLPPADGLTGCFVEINAAGNFLIVGDRKATAGIGAGCDMRLAKALSWGMGFRADSGEIKSGSAQLRLGFDVNSGLKIYPFGEWRWTDWKAFDVGQLYVGLGAETSLLDSKTSFGVEVSTAVSKAGTGMTNDDIAVRGLLRHRF
jgi:hypothetical protein